jgi:hypothetical protein
MEPGIEFAASVLGDSRAAYVAFIQAGLQMSTAAAWPQPIFFPLMEGTEGEGSWAQNTKKISYGK